VRNTREQVKRDALCSDAYEDPRFNKDIDLKTGYRTRTILCAPLKNESAKVIGRLQTAQPVGKPPYLTSFGSNLSVPIEQLLN